MDLYEHVVAGFRDIAGRPPECVSAAPGRLEFIGNHTDYNGGNVMGLAVDRAVAAAAALRSDGRIILHSPDHGDAVDIDAAALHKLSGASSWANYPLGVIQVLGEEGISLSGGLDMVFASDLPAGAGMSSSAAIELATALAVASLAGRELAPARLAGLCRRAENDFVGMPCGILDQGVSAFGQKDALVHIRTCDEAFSTVPIPSNVHFWVFNTNKKHALTDSQYANRFNECAQALERLKQHLPEITFLTSATLQHAEQFLEGDIRKRASHVIAEHARVAEADAALRKGDLARVGQLLFDSHESSRVLFENSTPELDFLVQCLASQKNVYGARLTGGGWGGAVMAMTSEHFGQAHGTDVAGQYEERFGLRADTFHVKVGHGARLLGAGPGTGG